VEGQETLADKRELCAEESWPPRRVREHGVVGRGDLRAQDRERQGGEGDERRTSAPGKTSLGFHVPYDLSVSSSLTDSVPQSILLRADQLIE
jgi:hypothetical protein